MASFVNKVLRDGSKRVQAVVRIGDATRPVKATFATREEAEAWAAAKEAELLENLAQPAYEYTLNETINEFASHNLHVDVTDLRTKLSHLLDYEAQAITPQSLDNLSNDQLDTLARVYEYARRHLGVVVPQNPVLALRAAKDAFPFRPITALEEQWLLDGATSLANGTLRLILILALDSGLSQADILDLQVKNFDAKAGVLDLGSERIIPLTTRAKEALTERTDIVKHGKLFDLPRNTVQAAFIRLKAKFGMEGPDFNDLRKLAISRLSQRMTIQQLKHALGYARYDSLLWLIDSKDKLDEYATLRMRGI